MLTNFLTTRPADTLLSEPDTLAVLEFEHTVSTLGSTPLRLRTLKESNQTITQNEVWKSSTKIINKGSTDGCIWRYSDDYLFIAVDLDCTVNDDLEAVSEQAYKKLLSIIVDSNYKNLIRFWNIIPRINAGIGDGENYKRFCNGRLNAFNEFSINSAQFPAASAVGHHDDGITVYAIAGKIKPSHIGNPRQIEAFNYPRQYGPTSPSFARATNLELTNENRLFFISGTASILGHDSVHVGDLIGQLHTTNDNILYLLKEVGLKRNNIQSLRVYLRHLEHYQETMNTLKNWCPHAQIIITHADICRSDLLVEIECYCVSS